MADQAKVEIVTVDAITNLNDLRKTISDAKTALNQLTVGSEDYRKQLVELDKAQMVLKNAVNGTTATEEDYVNALQGTSKTYNTLVKQMADMKKALRNIDVSTDEGAESFRKMAADINAVNDELKAMDAMKGDFQRNVGNYKSALDGVGGVLTQMPPTLGKAKKELGDLGQTMQLVGKQPILGIIGLLAPIITKIVEGLKDNDAALVGVKKAMDALKPVMDFFSGILETIGSWLGNILTKASAYLSSNGIFQKVIQGVMGVGNAILQYVIAPFKGVIAAIKVFKEQGVKGLGDAARAFGAEMKNGFSFKQNFQAGQTAADTILDGMASRKPKAKETGKEIGKELGKGVAEGLANELNAILDNIDKAWDKKLDERQKLHEKRQKEIADYNKEQAAQFLKEQEEEADAEANAWLESYHKQEEAAKEAAAKKKAVMEAYVTGTVGLMNTLADALESGEDASEGQVKAAKNLRIAAATIDMISGAVTAFSTAQQLGPIAGPIVGAINAAAVVASGLANIAKIKATNVSKDSAPTSSAPATATVSAPSLPAVTPTTVTTGASTETALNNASRPQKVYVLQSDIEAAGETSKVQVAESSF